MAMVWLPIILMLSAAAVLWAALAWCGLGPRHPSEIIHDYYETIRRVNGERIRRGLPAVPYRPLDTRGSD